MARVHNARAGPCVYWIGSCAAVRNNVTRSPQGRDIASSPGGDFAAFTR
nr:hypothetical protein [uncultured bacterium]